MKLSGFVKFRRLAILLLVLMIAGGVLSYAIADDPPTNASLIVKMVSGLSTEEQAAVIVTNGGTEISSIPALRSHVVEVPTSDLSTIIQNYQNDPRVVSVEENTIQITSIPAAPLSLIAKPTSSSSIVLTWKDNSNNETGFKIERKTGACDSINEWAQIVTKEANVKTHTNTGLTANTTYSYRIRAYNAVGNSSYSKCASAKTALSGTPKAPRNLNATSISGSEIKLIWTDNSTSEASFKVYRRVGTGTWSLLATKDTNVVSHTDTAAAGNTARTAYSYYVKACNGSGCSPTTNYAVVPYKPTSLRATAVSSSRINLKWVDESSNETGFQIERKNGSCLSTNSWSKIKTARQNVTSCSNTGLASGKTYSYRVRAYRKSSAMPYAYGYSLYSKCKSATTP